MKHSRSLTIGVLGLALGMILASPALASEWELSPSSVGGTIATVSVHPGVVTLTPNVPFERVRFVVSGPDGIVFDKLYTETPISWQVEDYDGNTLADGRYSFELRFDFGQELGRPVDLGESPQVKREEAIERRNVSGSFSVQGGTIDTNYRSSIPSREAAQLRDSMEAPTTKAYDYDFLFISSKIGIGIDDSAAVPDAALQIQEQTPTGILLEDRVGGYGTALEGQWRLKATTNAFTIGHDPTPTTSGGERENFVIEEGGEANALYVDSSGALGLGTSTPFGSLEIADSQFFVQLFFTANDGVDWVGGIEANASENLFKIEGASEQDTVNIDLDAPANSLNVASNGNVGLGTMTAEKKLEVAGGDILLSNNRWFQARMNGGGIASMFWLDGSNDVNFSAPAGRNLTLRNGGSTKMIIAGTQGRVGIGTTSPAYPLHMGSGARVTVGGVWTDASSREYKKNIENLPLDEALATVMSLSPVTFDYKNGGESHVGFIAEDVPDLVATEDRKGMSPMDVVAVLTRVVQEQQKTIDALSARIEQLERDR